MSSTNQFTNNAATTLSAALTASSTTIALAAGTGALFPILTAGQVFAATLVNATSAAIEIVRVTSVSSDTMTVTRAQQGTTALAFSVGDKFELRITAGNAANWEAKANAGANSDITSLSAIGSINNGALAGTRNRVINGDMRVTQRGTSGSLAAGVFTYSSDQILAQISGAASSFSNITSSTGPTGYFSALGINGAAGCSNPTIAARIEAMNCWDMMGQQITVSFWVYNGSAAAMTPAISVYRANAQDNFSAITQEAAVTCTPSSVPINSWTKVTGSVSLSGAATTGLFVQCQLTGSLPASTVAYFTKFQVEQGAVASTFEQLPYGQALSLCQRYLYKFTGGGVASFDTNAFASISNVFPVTLRGSPTITTSTVGTFVYNGQTYSSSTPTSSTANANAYAFTVTTGAPANSSAYCTPGSWSILYSSEL